MGNLLQRLATLALATWGSLPTRTSRSRRIRIVVENRDGRLSLEYDEQFGPTPLARD